MAGTLIVRDDATWMPASWLHDEVLTHLADGVAATEPQLAEVLRAGRTEVSIGFADLRPISGTSLDSLLAAVTDLLSGLLRAAQRGGPDADSARQAVRAVAELRALLRTDGRHGERAASGTLLVGEGTQWSAPAWAVDLVVDTLRSAIPELGSDRQDVDLRSLEVEPFRRAVADIDRLVARYRGETPAISQAPELRALLAPRLEALAELVHADRRIRAHA